MVKSAKHGPASAVHAELAAIAESTHESIIGLTLQGIITSWNPAAARLYGYEPQEIVGRPAQVLYLAGRSERSEQSERSKRSDENKEAEFLRLVADGEQVHWDHLDRRRKDGTVVAVKLTALPVVGANGTVVGVVTVSSEVAPRWASESQAEAGIYSERHAVRDAQDRYDLRVDAERHAALDAQEQYHLKVNAERRAARVAQEQYDLKVDAERRAAREVQDSYDLKVDAERRGVRDAQDQYDSRRDSERHEAFARKERLQAQLQQAQRLENLGQLAGGVAHDFNNLLAVILNYVSFVSEELAAATTSDWAVRLETARSDLAQVTRAADRATSLTRQLLAFARREVVRPQVLDLDTVITAVEDMLRRTLGEDVDLVTSLDGHLWPVLADPGQLEQVLVNLAVNARDAMPSGGTLTIDTSNSMVDADSIAGGSRSPEGRNVRLRVSDTGTGMTRDVIEHAFEPFFTTKDGGGTGLGLATVYGILAQNEGQIQIYSEPGTGTTFSIMLPVTAEAAIPTSESAPYQRTPKGETVLIVEDEEALREVTKRIFTRNGYRVITAADGPEAVGVARDHPGEIHLLVTDVVMPRMLGKDVAEKVRAIKPEIEVLFMSGYAQPVLTSQGRLDPNVALVEKPFSEADLLAKSGQVLNGNFRGFKTIQGKA